MIIIRIGLGITTVRGSSRTLTGATTRTRDLGAAERRIPISFAAPTRHASTVQTDDVEISSTEHHLRDTPTENLDVKDEQVCLQFLWGMPDTDLLVQNAMDPPVMRMFMS